MASNSNRSVSLVCTGDISLSSSVTAAQNTASPAAFTYMNLASGANTITVPTAGGVTPTAVTIIKPSDNTVLITLKGVTGDTGVKLHLTDPDAVSLNSAQATFCLTAASSLTGLILVWT